MKKLVLSLSILGLAACSSEKSSNQNDHHNNGMESSEGTMEHQNGHMESPDEAMNHADHEQKPQASKSPRTSAMAMTGGNHIHLDYSAPSVRGRQVFGGLVAMNEVWVTGAHKATSIQFDKPVKIAGKRVEAGKYGLFTIPGQNEWTVILNQVWDMHLADDYDQSKDVIRFQVKPENLSESVETLSFKMTEKGPKTTQISMAWDKTKITFDVENAE